MRDFLQRVDSGDTVDERKDGRKSERDNEKND